MTILYIAYFMKSYQNSNDAFKGVEKSAVPKFMWKHTWLWIIKTISRKKNKAEGIILSDFKLGTKLW